MRSETTVAGPRATGRTRRPRGSLGPEVILDTAEAIASADGFEALTMRAVAASLGAVPMALYNHVATKDDLVDALLDRVLARFEAPPATDDWGEDLRSFAHAHRRLLMDHPWAVRPLFAQPNPGLGAVRIGEVALGILRRGGIRGDQAVAAFSGILALSYGWSAFTSARDLVDGPAQRVAATLAALPRSEFPLTVDVASEMGGYGSEAHWSVVLDQQLQGIRTAAAGPTT